MASSTSTIPQQIRENWGRLKRDPEVEGAFRKLDSGRYQAELWNLREGLASMYNFESYKRALHALKTRRGELNPHSEKLFADRCDATARAYGALISQSAEHLTTMSAQSGLDSILSRHAWDLFWELPLNPYVPQLGDLLRELGASEAELSHYAASLRAKGWNPLNFGDGSVAGLRSIIGDEWDALKKMASAARAHGVPMLEGAGGGNGASATTVVLIVVFGVCCVAGAVTLNWWTCVLELGV